MLHQLPIKILVNKGNNFNGVHLLKNKINNYAPPVKNLSLQ